MVRLGFISIASADLLLTGSFSFFTGEQVNRLRLLLQQSVGQPGIPIVEVGDQVRRGQCIAEPSGLGCKIHASTSGVVHAVTDEYIEIDSKPLAGGRSLTETDYVKIKDCETIADYAFEAGVVGAGGAGFPAHIKLQTQLDNGVVIANAAECEPVLSHNVTLIEEDAPLFLRGLQLAMESTGAAKGIVAIKKKYKRAAASLIVALKEFNNIEIKWLPEEYPVGDERVIIRETLGVILEPGELPVKANAVVCNVETLKNLALAVDQKKPVIDKDITVGGRVKDAQTGKVFLNIPIGSTLETYIEECGGFVAPYGEIVGGGPFTGQSVQASDPVTKTTGGILVAVPFPKESKKVGVIACECGAQEERLKEIAAGMGAEVVAEARCKRMIEVNGRYRCDQPGQCPGQAEKVLSLKKQGAEAIITGTCED